MRSKPRWLVREIPRGRRIFEVQTLLSDLGLNTVCHFAKCPNRGECFSKGTATFLIMGNVCTRNCRFCAISHGVPGPLAEDEPARVAEAARRLHLKHVVVTSVTRDDLPDGGAQHFARTIAALRSIRRDIVVEVLTPDFQGLRESIMTVIEARPNIFNHNVETVPRLYPSARPEASYALSLEVLRGVKKCKGDRYTKSGLMVGLGETRDEVVSVMRDLRGVGCDIVTIGQYLQPSRDHLEVHEYVHPEVFEAYKHMGEEIGFRFVASAPYVRSSYNASAFFEGCRKAQVC
ncbi:MAG: lipoyl synthase [Deltaproteobacteria bacterium]|nr:lipoyl synthase [Deltaproteobacteria bacterium]